MSRSSFSSPSSTASKKGRSIFTEKQIEALTVAMIVAPGVYVRNRMFDLLSSPGARRARTRAGVVRGILPQLARATGVTIATESQPHGVGGDVSFVLRYQIPAVRLTRVVELSAAELAALRVVAERANIRCVPVEPGDKELVATAVTRLLEARGGRDNDESTDLSRLAREIITRPPPPPGE